MVVSWYGNCVANPRYKQNSRRRTLSMPSDDRTDGNRASLRRLLIGTSALPAAALAMMLVFPRDVSAANIDYVFSSDASLAFADSHVEDVSGSFVFNTTLSTVSNVNIILAGPSPEADTYDTNPFYTSDPPGPALCSHVVGPAGTVPMLCMWFTAPLGGSTDAFVTTPNQGIGFFPTDPGINVDETVVAGGVSSESAIPEPSTLALLAGAIGFFGLRRRAARLERSPPAVQPQ
jgi:hypothetical protein